MSRISSQRLLKLAQEAATTFHRTSSVLYTAAYTVDKISHPAFGKLLTRKGTARKQLKKSGLLKIHEVESSTVSDNSTSKIEIQFFIDSYNL